MSVIEPPVIIAERWDVSSTPWRTTSPTWSPPDVTGGGSRCYDAEGRLLKIEADGSRVRIRDTEASPGHAGELEEFLRGFLERADEPANRDLDLPNLVAACDKYTVETPDSFRAVLSGFFDDFWRSFRGRELRRRGRG